MKTTKENPIEKSNRIIAEATKWMMRFTGILAIVSLLSAWILYNQYTAMKIDQRAWVAPSEINTRNETSDKRFRITFKNTGKTPALEMSGWTIVDSQLNWEEGDKKQFPLECLIAPNGTISNDPFDTSTVCPIASSDKANAVQTPVFFFGKIWYKDIFGGNHWTEFSYRFTKIVDAEGFIIQPWGDHNRTDDKQTQK